MLSRLRSDCKCKVQLCSLFFDLTRFIIKCLLIALNGFRHNKLRLFLDTINWRAIEITTKMVLKCWSRLNTIEIKNFTLTRLFSDKHFFALVEAIFESQLSFNVAGLCDLNQWCYFLRLSVKDNLFRELINAHSVTWHSFLFTIIYEQLVLDSSSEFKCLVQSWLRT